MPVRIYDIAKKLGIESKEVLAKAKELGMLHAKVPSSTLDKITAEYLGQELEKLYPPKPAIPPPPPPPVPAAEPPPPITAASLVEPLAITTPSAALSPAAPVVGPAPTTAPPEEAAVKETTDVLPAPVIPAKEPSLEAAPAPSQTLTQPAPVEAPKLVIPVETLPPVSITEPGPAEVKIEIPSPAVTVALTPTAALEIPEAVPPPVPVEESKTPIPAAPPAKPEGTPESKVEVVIPQPETPKPTSVPAPVQPAAPPPPPPPPPPPKVGDKVGFIQLPPKPSPKVGDKVGSLPLPGRAGGRAEATRGKADGKGTRPAHTSGQTKFSGPTRPFGAGIYAKTPGAKPEVTKPLFQPPQDGELITMKPPIVVRVLAELVKKKPFQLIGDLMGLGVFANVNQTIEETVAQRLCAKYGFRFEVEKRERGAGIVHAPVKAPELDVDDKIEDLKPRPPVVTIMGHVDHGKTTLLDVIRKSNVAAGEAGGITQHIGAYTISFPHPERHKEIQQITFLDTPGHAAFSAMRARGANVTDIVVLVVAANDGVMPQTIEAINHAQAAKVQIMVAVNKCDHPNANPMRVRQQLQEYGLVCEEWGGTVIFQDVSALTKKGVEKMLELILLQAEVMELKANPNRPAKGNVIESGLEPGGPTATVLVRKGTLKVGDLILCGSFWGKARALINEEGKRLKSAGPSVAVKLLGLNGVPEAGLKFSVVEDEKTARDLGEQHAEAARIRGSEDRPKITLENLFATLSPESTKALKVVVKADTQGSVEAIVEALKKIESTKVSLEIVHSAVGIITESDVILASASKAIVLGFHTRVDGGAADAAKQEGVQIKLYAIIYELIDEVKEAMAGLLEPVSKEVVLGSADVRKIFALSKGGNVAGCMVVSGRVVKGRCRILRRKDVIFEGLINSIKRFQDEVNEVRAGLECGIRLDGFHEYQTGDQIECYHLEKVAQKL